MIAIVFRAHPCASTNHSFAMYVAACSNTQSNGLWGNIPLTGRCCNTFIDAYSCLQECSDLIVLKLGSGCTEIIQCFWWRVSLLAERHEIDSIEDLFCLWVETDCAWWNLFLLARWKWIPRILMFLLCSGCFWTVGYDDCFCLQKHSEFLAVTLRPGGREVPNFYYWCVTLLAEGCWYIGCKVPIYWRRDSKHMRGWFVTGILWWSP